MKNLLPTLIKKYQKRFDAAQFAYNNPRKAIRQEPQLLSAGSAGVERVREDSKVLLTILGGTISSLENAKTIILSHSTFNECVRGLGEPGNSIGIELPLPFTAMFFQFEGAIDLLDDLYRIPGEDAVEIFGLNRHVIGLSVRESYFSEAYKDKLIRQPLEMEKGDWIVSFTAHLVDAPPAIIIDHYDPQGVMKDSFSVPKNISTKSSKKMRIAVAAILRYINQPNTILEKQGGAEEKVNRRREKDGKLRLEPYYLCRIKKVQAEETHATGTGVPHGHIYDVRGHIRRYKSGKEVQVRPHKRGLKNEVYLPKTYVLEIPKEGVA
jgi:hypothetical protein